MRCYLKLVALSYLSFWAHESLLVRTDICARHSSVSKWLPGRVTRLMEVTATHTSDERVETGALRDSELAWLALGLSGEFGASDTRLP